MSRVKHQSNQDPLKSKNCPLIRLFNCRLIRDHDLVWDQLWIRNGVIIDPCPVFFDEKEQPDINIDCEGNIVAPGFIDLQINGGYGYDFSNVSQTAIALETVSKGITSHGVTSFCPTLITSSRETYHQILPVVRELTLSQRRDEVPSGANILGCHLEGPFISHHKRGAHPVDLINSKPLNSVSDVESMYGEDNVEKDLVSIVTLAPELDIHSNVVRSLTKRGIVVSLGHSEASLKQGEQAVESGARFITHLFNAMPPFHHRDPGLVGLLTSNMTDNGKDIFYGIIADGIHTHYSALKIAFRSHPLGCVLVTDAISALGLASGSKHKIGESVIEIRDKKAYVSGTDTLAGSIAGMDECVRNLCNFSDCSIVEGVECATLHPAQVLGIENKKGTLNFGADADFVIMDDDINILQTFIRGVKVYSRD